MGKRRGGMQGVGGEMMRQAARMQRKMEELKEELKDREVSTTGVGDKIKATVTCDGRVRSIEVDPEFFEEEGLEMTLDAVTATVNSALELADKTAQGEMEGVTGGLKLPGLSG